MSCAHCTQLEEEIAYLRSELGLQEELTTLASLRHSLGFERGQGAIVMRLYRAHGRVVTTTQLEEAIPARWGRPNGDRGLKIVDVYICRIRKVLGFSAILTSPGQGYQLSPIGRERIRQALDGADNENLTPTPQPLSSAKHAARDRDF